MTELREVEVSDVYQGDRLAGQLRREGDDVVFSYDAAHLADPDARPVAFSLPLSCEPVRAGPGRRRRSSPGCSPRAPGSHLTLLLLVGGDAIGDVRVVPHGVPPVDPVALWDTDAPDVDVTALFARATSTDPERLDRVALPGVQVKVSAAVMATPLGRYPAAKYRITLQEAALALADAVELAGGSRPLALRRVLETAAVSYLIGNGDLHGKKLAVRAAPDGLWEVTPAYDLLCTQPYTGWSDPMAVPLYGRANRLARRWWLDAAQRWELPERVVHRSLDRIVAAVEPWIDRVGKIGFDDAATDRLAELLRTRRAELAG